LPTGGRDNLKEELIEACLRLAGQQWASLGASLRADPPPEAVVDPEALIWFTLEVGRHDARLFAEAVDWLEVNGRDVAVGRLRKIGPPADDVRWRILSAVARRLVRQDKSVAWGRLAEAGEKGPSPLLERPVALFASAGRAETTGVRDPDPDFAALGLTCSVLRTRGASRRPDLTRPATLILRARALFGAKAAAEAWAALLSRDRWGLPDLAALTGHAGKALSTTIKGFVDCGVCEVQQRRPAQYSLKNREHWRHVFDLPFYPPWPKWSRLFAAIVDILRSLADLKGKNATEYILSSELRKVFGAVKDDLLAPELAVGAPHPGLYLAEEFLPRLRRYLLELLDNALFLSRG